MTAQMVHLGVVQGAAWIPWMVVGELRLAQIFLPGIADTKTIPDEADRDHGHPAPAWREALPWVLLVGCSGGLVFLVGNPSMADAAWICVLCAAWWLFRSYRSGSQHWVCEEGRSSLRSLQVGCSQFSPEELSCFPGSAFCPRPSGRLRHSLSSGPGLSSLVGRCSCSCPTYSAVTGFSISLSTSPATTCPRSPDT